jgi:hypothetical protein
MWFQRKADWKRHEELHFPQEHWICCSKEFARLDKWREHRRGIHKSNPSPSEIESARKPIAGSFPRNCRYCGFETTGWTEWIDHVADHFVSKIPRGFWEKSNCEEVVAQVNDKNDDGQSSSRTRPRKSECNTDQSRDAHTNDRAAGNLVDGVHVRVFQSLFDGVKSLLYRRHPSQRQPAASKSSSSKAASLCAVRGSTSSNSSNRGQRGQRTIDKSPYEDSEEERPNQGASRKSASRPPTIGIEFACPYYKANSGRQHPKRCERGSWKTISKLKHVSSIRSLPISPANMSSVGAPSATP